MNKTKLKEGINMRSKEFSTTVKAVGWLTVWMALAPFLCDAAFVNQTTTLVPGLGDGHAAWGDFNNDTYPDLYDGAKLWRNNSGTNFTALPGYGWGIWGDYDNDGNLDLFILAGTSRVMRNLTGGGFRQLTLPTLPTIDNHGACWADFDNDSYVDIYVTGYEFGGNQPDAILSNKQGTEFDLTWQEGPPDSGVFAGRGVTACDFDRDGDQDIFVSNYRLAENFLWQNNGSGSFVDVTLAYNADEPESWGGTAGAHTIGSAWGDLDNDGNIDLFVGNFAHPAERFPGYPRQPESQFLRNLGSAGNYYFEDMRATAGLAYQESYASPALGDYDNDGDLDLFFTTVYATASFGVPNHPVLYRNNGDWTFTDVTAAEGVNNLGSTYQAAWADFDNDGDLDLVTDVKLFVNDASDTGTNHWIKVHLAGDGETVNKAAIGAQVRIALGSEILVRQVEAGTGEGNQNDLTLHFGLGNNAGPVTLDILWPDGSIQSVSNVDVDRRIDVSMQCEVSNDSVTDITHNSATLNGILTSPYDSADVRIYWGTVNGNNTANWQHSLVLPDQINGSFSTDITGLTPNTLYYFHCYTSNAFGVGWAETSAKFATTGLLPFEETYWGGSQGGPGEFDGENGWRVNPESAAFATYLGGQGDGLWNCHFASSGMVWHAFSGASRTNIVWIDLYSIPGSNAVEMATSALKDKSAVVCVNPTSGRISVYDGELPKVVGLVDAPSSDWTRLTIRGDYATRTWDLWVNTTNIARNLEFSDQTVSAFSELGTLNSSDGKMDSVKISNKRPFDIPFIDDDYDSLDDDWEVYYFGSTTNTAGTTGEDADEDGFDDICEFLAGTDPTDNTSLLAILNVWPAAGSAVVLQWSSVENMHYAILESTNLLGAWIPVVSNITATPPVNTNAVTTTPNTPVFYRIQLGL